MIVNENLELHNWKKLTDDEKKEAFSFILMYYVNPLMSADNVTLTSFEMGGMKCRTIEVDLNGETFVFIPGQKETVLGWDFGTQGLKTQDLLGGKESEREDLQQTFKSLLSAEELIELHSELGVSQRKTYNFSLLEDIGNYINDFTTNLRKIDIPPLLVSKKAVPVGGKLQGIYNSVTGDCSGTPSFLADYREEIRELLSPSLTIEESLSWSYPSHVLKPNHFYLEQGLSNEDNYFVYEHQGLTYHQLQLSLDQQGYELLSEDQWEYAVGGGTRRLFRWGNEITFDYGQPFRSVIEKVAKENMFGLLVDYRTGYYELTNNRKSVKHGIVQQNQKSIIQQILPLSSYFQSGHQLDEKDYLNPALYMYRKAIVILDN